MWETLIKSLGLDPKKIGAQVDQFQAGTVEALETLKRIEAKLDTLLEQEKGKTDDIHA